MGSQRVGRDRAREHTRIVLWFKRRRDTFSVKTFHQHHVTGRLLARHLLPFSVSARSCPAATLCRSGSLRRVRRFATPWPVARQAPLSLGCSRQESWSGLPCPLPGDLPNPGPLHCRWILYHLRHEGKPQSASM